MAGACPGFDTSRLFPLEHFKDQVFSLQVRPQNVADLQTRITEEFNAVSNEIIRAACQSLPEKCQLCIALDGKQLKLAEFFQGVGEGNPLKLAQGTQRAASYSCDVRCERQRSSGSIDKRYHMIKKKF